MASLGYKFDRKLRVTFWIVTGTIFLSGLLWHGSQIFLRVRDEFIESPHALEQWSKLVHGFSVLPFLLLAGALLPRHVFPAFASGRLRGTGISLSALVLVLSISGFGLYYFGAENLRELARMTHVFAGYGLPALLAVHVFLAKR